MPETLITAFFSTKRILAGVVLLGVLAPGTDALAQMSPNPPPPPAPVQAAPTSSPVCTRLEAQLAMVDRGGTGDPARDDQIRRYQDAASKQQAELDRVTAQARRMGCSSSGFFSLFSGQSSQCGPVNTQIEQMRSNLDQITNSLERLRGGGGYDRESQRRSVLTALVQNSCGQQYANALNSSGGGGSGPGNFFSNLFGGGSPASAPGGPGDAAGPIDNGGQSGTYRTVCVRSCDGYYFPISFATVPARFGDDEKTCKALCPAADASLFTYRNPGEDMNSAVSLSGQSYSSIPNAFAYRQKFNPTCSCKAAGQTWAEALKNIDDKSTAQQGDITVTEENSKRLSQAPNKPAPAAKKGNAPAGTAPAASSDPSNTASSNQTTGGQGVRTVGPTFIPAH
jgi:hypothetical protein